MIDKSLFSLPGIKKVLSLLMVLSALQALVIIGQAFTLSTAIVNLWQGEPLQPQWAYIAGFLALFISQQVIVYFEDAFLDSYAYEQSDNLREQVLKRVFTSGSEVVQAKGTGNVTTTVLEGVEQVETYLRLILPKMTGMAIIPLILVIYAFTLDRVSGLIMVLVFPFIIMYMVILGKNAQARAAKQYKQFQLLSNHFIDSLRGIDTLKFFGISKQHGKNIYEVSEEFRKATIKTLRVATLSSLVLDLFATFSLAAIAIMLGLRLLDTSIVLFPALSILILAPQYFKPIREFASDFHASLDGKNALAAINDLINTPEAESSDTPLQTWSEQSVLKVEHLDYSYPDFKALDDLAFEVNGCSKVGIVGLSGSGKSTLINVMGGFFSPDEGSITIDGQKIDSFKQPDWQKQVIYLPQQPYIFHASLRENIAFYHPEATDEDIAKAVNIVGLDELISELPEGIDTRIGEGARPLSGGQAQRIALARAFLDTSRKILLFDEPTAHLDIETEMELKEKMLPLMENRLVFFATHRLHWMNNMDSIVVMEGGEAIEQGALVDLLDKESGFMRLASEMNRGIA